MATTNELLGAIDADEAKAVVLQVLDFAGEIAAMTPWPWDDKAVAVAKNLVERPLVWKVVIRLINSALPETALPAGVAFGSESDELFAVISAEDTAGIDPVTIVTLITTLLPLIQKTLAWWKQRRDNKPTPAVA